MIASAAKAFAFLEPAVAQRFFERCTERQFSAGATLFAAGQEVDWLGVVLNGKLVVKTESMFPGRFILLAAIEAGGLVGEGALLADEQHRTTVVADQDSRLLVIKRSELGALGAEDPALLLELQARALKVLRRRLHAAGERLAWIL
ncbi:MAG: cyclic nucleotide-binding domain-containing protein [Desulfurivibrio sp.]|nr:cyclic nucleotide-binding domain-containing protein [Desulfurivibrio sp.]